MKGLITIGITLIISTLIYGQYSSERMNLKGKVKELKLQTKKPSTSGWWDIENFIYQFDKHGNRVFYETFLLNSEGGKSTYIYDSNNQLIQEKYEDKGAAKTVIVHKYTYNDKKQLVKEEKESDSEMFQKTKDLKLYEYDANGNLIKKTEEGHFNNEVKTYTYDKNNKLIKEGSSKLKPNEGTVYEYDNRGNKIKMGIVPDNGGFMVYKYNNLNQLIEAIGYKGKNKSDDRTTYKYNEEGRITEEKHYNLYGYDDVERLTSITTWEYDQYQNITKEEKYLGGGTHISHAHYSYIYDSYGNWTQKKSFDNPHSKKPAEIQTRTFTYYE